MPLRGDKARGRRIGLLDLIAAGMEAIGQIERAADRGDAIDQRFGRAQHVDLAFRCRHL